MHLAYLDHNIVDEVGKGQLTRKPSPSFTWKPYYVRLIPFVVVERARINYAKK